MGGILHTGKPGPTSPTHTHTPGTHVPSWLKYSDQGFSGPLPLPIPGTLALAFWLISSVGKISSACLRFRFNWPCMSFLLPDFQSIQDLIIKEPPCSTHPGGSIFFLERGVGRGVNWELSPSSTIALETTYQKRPRPHQSCPFTNNPTWSKTHLLPPCTSDHRGDHQEVSEGLAVTYTKGNF